MAFSAYDNAVMSSQEKDIVKKLSDSWSSASKEEQSNIHTAVESIRAKYGYSGGDDGTSFIQKAVSTAKSAVNTVTNTVKKSVSDTQAVNKTADALSSSVTSALPDMQYVFIPSSSPSTGMEDATIPTDFQKMFKYLVIMFGVGLVVALFKK